MCLYDVVMLSNMSCPWWLGFNPNVYMITCYYVSRLQVLIWMSVLSPKAPCLMVNRLFPCVRRISQDLAKDLAILAREIHDVAGEIDSVSSSGTAPSTTVSTAATTPGSAIDTREEVGPARSTQPDIQESMRKVPAFLLLSLPWCVCFYCAFAIPLVLLG